MSIVTKTGDGGDTGLVDGTRIPKSDIRLHAYGTVDELNAVLGLALSGTPHPMGEGLGERENERSHLLRLQHLLFRLGSDLASPRQVKNAKRIGKEQTKEIEGWIKEIEAKLPPLRAFILPGGSETASLLHLARTVCRRAERWTVALAEFEEINRETIVLLNRLSDYLFLAAREANRKADAADEQATY